MRILPYVVSLALSLATLPCAVNAWGPNGHRITAKIGEDNMTPAAREAMKDLTGSRSLALLSTWPDFVRSDNAYDCLKPWHILSSEDGQDVEEALDDDPVLSDGCDKNSFAALGMPKNVVSAIGFLSAVLEGDNAKTVALVELMDISGAEPLHGSIQLTALAFLVHVVGDVHQPLHVGRASDLGGNWVKVKFFDTPGKNLHEVWDERLINRQQLSYSEFAGFLEQDFADAPAVGFGDGPVTWA